MRIGTWTGLGTLALLALTMPSASAHPFATPIDNFTNNANARCYYYDDHDTNTREVWMETNGEREGGVPEAQEWFGLPPIFGGAGSGLQRTVVGSTPADTLLDPVTAAQLCTL